MLLEWIFGHLLFGRILVQVLGQFSWIQHVVNWKLLLNARAGELGTCSMSHVLGSLLHMGGGVLCGGVEKDFSK